MHLQNECFSGSVAHLLGRPVRVRADILSLVMMPTVQFAYRRSSRDGNADDASDENRWSRSSDGRVHVASHRNARGRGPAALDWSVDANRRSRHGRRRIGERNRTKVDFSDVIFNDVIKRPRCISS